MPCYPVIIVDARLSNSHDRPQHIINRSILHHALAGLRRGRARQLPALPFGVVRRPRRPAPRSGHARQRRQRLCLRESRAAAAWYDGAHRPVPPRLLRAGGQAGQRPDRAGTGAFAGSRTPAEDAQARHGGARHRGVGHGHGTCAPTGSELRPQPAARRNPRWPAALPGRRRCRPLHRALRRVHPHRRQLHPFPRPSALPARPGRPAERRHARAPAPTLARPAGAGPVAAQRPRDARDRRAAGGPGPLAGGFPGRRSTGRSSGKG